MLQPAFSGGAVASTQAAMAVFVQTQLPARAEAKATRLSVAPAHGSTAATGEIQAYIAIRDLLLAEAERAATDESLRRASIANGFVETCLQPSRSPYEAQYLSRVDAVREAERCCAAKMRLAQLEKSAAHQ